MNYWESYYIDLYNSTDTDKGYNKLFGGKNYIRSEEQKKRASEKQKQYIENNPEEKQRLSNMNTKYWESEENRTLKSEQMKRVTRSKLHRLKMALVQGAKPFNVFRKDSKEFVGEWTNKAECARNLDIDSRKVCACLSGERKSHKGYTFEFN